METHNIILCKTCKGTGNITWDECVNYHKREYETYSRVCERCDGKGRVIEIITTTYKKLD